MPDLTVVWILLAIVALIIIGQWLMTRRARLAIGPVPPGLAEHNPDARVFYFYAPKCGSCRLMWPQIEELQQRFGAMICPINVKEHPELARSAKVMGTPTTLFIDQGEIISAHLGVLSDKEWIAGMTAAGLTDALAESTSSH